MLTNETKPLFHADRERGRLFSSIPELLVMGLYTAAGFTAEYSKVLKRGETIEPDEKAMGWVVSENGKVLTLTLALTLMLMNKHYLIDYIYLGKNVILI